MAYGYLHRGRVITADPATDSFELSSIGLARTSRWGPVPSAVPGIEVGDRVILGATGTSRDDLVIIAKVGADFPGIDDIPGLQDALNDKADDSDITTINSNIADLGNDIADLGGRVSGLEALDNVRMVAALSDVTAPVPNQLVWLTPERRFYRWVTEAAMSRWSLSATPGQVIGGKRRITNAAATLNWDELAVLDTGPHNFEQDSVYLIEAFLTWQASSGGNDFLFRIREGTTIAGFEWARAVHPRTDDGYPLHTVVRFLRVTGGAESDGLSHAVTAQRIVGSGSCTVTAGSYVTVTYLGPVGFIDTV